MSDGKNYDIETKKRRPIKKYEIENKYYFHTLLTILNEIRENKHGISTYIIFYLNLGKKYQNINYTKLYSKVKKEISLYATGLRQSDILSEYLCYYRIIESIAKNSHQNYIANSIDLISNYNFGKLYIRHEQDELCVKPKNLFSLMKKRAIRRLKELKYEFGNNNDIAKYLYENLRCGIAHGKDKVIEYDLSKYYFKIHNDLYILKLIARKGIDDLVNKNKYLY